jgi:hypothetical protein
MPEAFASGIFMYTVHKPMAWSKDPKSRPLTVPEFLDQFANLQLSPCGIASAYITQWLCQAIK